MSAAILLRCNCSNHCPALAAIPAQTHSDARMIAQDEYGWTGDYLGESVDYAPGHQVRVIRGVELHEEDPEKPTWAVKNLGPCQWRDHNRTAVARVSIREEDQHPDYADSPTTRDVCSHCAVPATNEALSHQVEDPSYEVLVEASRALFFVPFGLFTDSGAGRISVYAQAEAQIGVAA